jgi:hypothetical protein
MNSEQALNNEEQECKTVHDKGVQVGGVSKEGKKR